MSGPLRERNFRLIYLLVIGNGAGCAFSLPVSRSFLQEIVERQELVGIPVVFAVATATYLIAWQVLARVRYVPLQVRDAAEGFFAQFAKGMAYLAARPRLLILGMVMQVPFVVVIVSNVIFPGYVENRLHSGAVVFGLADMSYGLAAFCASLLLPRVAAGPRREHSGQPSP